MNTLINQVVTIRAKIRLYCIVLYCISFIETYIKHSNIRDYLYYYILALKRGKVFLYLCVWKKGSPGQEPLPRGRQEWDGSWAPFMGSQFLMPRAKTGTPTDTTCPVVGTSQSCSRHSNPSSPKLE